MSTAYVNPTLLHPAPRVPGHPLLGSLLEFRRDRFGLGLRVAREHRDLAELKMGFFTILMASSPAAAREVLVEKNDAFVKSAGLAIFARPILGDGLLTAEAEVHKKQRRMLAPVFAHKRIAAYGDVMVERSERLRARLLSSPTDSPGGSGPATVDLGEEMMRLTLEIVGKTLFDAELAGDASAVGAALTAAMRQMMDAMIRLVPLPPVIPTPGNLRLRRTVGQLDAIVYRMIRERRASGEDRGAMLDMLLATRDADDGSALTDREVRDQAMTILLAGHETTANALAWTFYLLARNPEVRIRMEQEIDAALADRSATVDDLAKMPFTLQVLKEAMRLYPPAYIIGRKATRDVSIGDVRVRAGQVILVNVAGIQRRADLFADPDRFDPDRFAPELEKKLPPFAYLPFGGGPRVCIGNHFALMEGHLVLATLARKLRFELISDQPIEAEPLVTLRPKGGVPVRVVERS